MDLIRLYDAAKLNLRKIIWTMTPVALLFLLLVFSSVLVLLFDVIELFSKNPTTSIVIFFAIKLLLVLASVALFLYFSNLIFYRSLSMLVYENGKEYIINKFNEKFKKIDPKDLNEEFLKSNIFSALERLVPPVLYEFFVQDLKKQDLTRLENRILMASDANATKIIFQYIDEHFNDMFSIQQTKYAIFAIFLINTVLIFVL